MYKTNHCIYSKYNIIRLNTINTKRILYDKDSVNILIILCYIILIILYNIFNINIK